MSTNIAESLKAMLLDEREYPVKAIFNSIAYRFGEIFRKRYAEVMFLQEVRLGEIDMRSCKATLRLKYGNDCGSSIYNYSAYIFKRIIPPCILGTYLCSTSKVKMERGAEVSRNGLAIDQRQLGMELRLMDHFLWAIDERSHLDFHDLITPPTSL
ncbi:hypothetical protein CQW23_19405 [Capsicum baccatum]|uniref:Uncharacterized protein n=1 Tax=Capsicum baccatum TaxID=33114 RepID=A0A2G2W5P1_CAPBA|nr:hypothetical protein CQW23_19405 [Capsicum baccatum]